MFATGLGTGAGHSIFATCAAWIWGVIIQNARA
jgi:hypothetical protein